MGQTERGDRNGGEKASGQMAPPRDPCTPGRALGGSREQGGPEAGVRPPHAGRAGSGGSRDTVRWGVQTAREEEVPEEGSHVSKPEKARENCRQVSRRVSKSTGRRVCPAHGGLVGRCPSVSFPPPHSERGRHSGTPVPPGALTVSPSWGGWWCSGQVLGCGPERRQLQMASFPQQLLGTLAVTSFIFLLVQPFAA